MIFYIFKRIFLMVPTLFGISIISFVVIQLPPSDYLTSMLAAMADSDVTFSDAELARMRQSYGLDNPVIVQYFKLIWGS